MMKTYILSGKIQG